MAMNKRTRAATESVVFLGVVAAIVVREGQTVNALQTAPTIARIAKLDVMTVKAQISEADVVNVAPGQKAYFTVLGDPDRKYEAVLRGVEPAPENATENLTGQPNQPVYYNALFDVPNPDGRLKPAPFLQPLLRTDRLRVGRAEVLLGGGEQLTVEADRSVGVPGLAGPARKVLQTEQDLGMMVPEDALAPL